MTLRRAGDFAGAVRDAYTRALEFLEWAFPVPQAGLVFAGGPMVQPVFLAKAVSSPGSSGRSADSKESTSSEDTETEAEDDSEADGGGTTDPVEQRRRRAIEKEAVHNALNAQRKRLIKAGILEKGEPLEKVADKFAATQRQLEELQEQIEELKLTKPSAGKKKPKGTEADDDDEGGAEGDSISLEAHKEIRRKDAEKADKKYLTKIKELEESLQAEQALNEVAINQSNIVQAAEKAKLPAEVMLSAVSVPLAQRRGLGKRFPYEIRVDRDNPGASLLYDAEGNLAEDTKGHPLRLEDAFAELRNDDSFKALVYDEILTDAGDGEKAGSRNSSKASKATARTTKTGERKHGRELIASTIGKRFPKR